MALGNGRSARTIETMDQVILNPDSVRKQIASAFASGENNVIVWYETASTDSVAIEDAIESLLPETHAGERGYVAAICTPGSKSKHLSPINGIGNDALTLHIVPVEN